jgi:hypothetical protein
MRRLGLAVVAAVVTFAACDFEESLDEYCRQTGKCPDAGAVGGGGGAVGGGGGAEGDGGGALDAGEGDAGIADAGADGGGADAGAADAGSGDGGAAGVDAGSEPGEVVSVILESPGAAVRVFADEKRSFTLKGVLIDGGEASPPLPVSFVRGQVFGADGGRVTAGTLGQEYFLGADRADAGAREGYRLGDSWVGYEWAQADGGPLRTDVRLQFSGRLVFLFPSSSIPSDCITMRVELGAGNSNALGFLDQPAPLTLSLVDGGAVLVGTDGGCGGPLVDGRALGSFRSLPEWSLGVRATESMDLVVAMDSGVVESTTQGTQLLPLAAALSLNPDGGGPLLDAGMVRRPDGGAVFSQLADCVQARVAWRVPSGIFQGQVVGPVDPIAFRFESTDVCAMGTSGTCSMAGLFSTWSSLPRQGFVSPVLCSLDPTSPGSLTVSFPDGGFATTFTFPTP